MKTTDKVQAILSQEMDRKQFLQVVGAAALGIIGVTKIMQSINALSSKQTGKNQLNGYGITPYGK